MEIGKYSFGYPVFMAPMAGITDKAFREIIHLVGGRYTFTEMISDQALLYRNKKTFQMLDLEGEEEPRIVQLFGSDPQSMGEAAKMAVDCGASMIDINMGCPTPKIVRNGEGSALLRNLPLAVSIAAKVVCAVEVPVTVKIRLGWDSSSIIAPLLAPQLEAVGIRMLTVHARTREQYYGGSADWNWIKQIKQKSHIPVIGNGDILSPQEAENIKQETGCDGIMIGRGALGNPWLIGQVQHYLDTGEWLPDPEDSAKLPIILQHLEKLCRYKGEEIGIKEMRKHGAWYIKGMPNATAYKNQIMMAQDVNTMSKILIEAFSRGESARQI